MTLTSEARSPSVTSWQKERDGLLDRISHLQDVRDRATDFLAHLASEVQPITSFDVGEAVKILWETPEASHERRFPTPVLDSDSSTNKEDTQ